VLHDVAPDRWEACTRVLREVQELARRCEVELPVTLLVVPQWHGAAATPEPYLWWLRRLVRKGHEIALHGLTHRDDGPAPRGLLQRLQRRFYTAGEGEFAALERAPAAARLADARAWAHRHGLAATGFVAPAWLLSRGSWDALADAGFGYTCTLTRLVALPGRSALDAPAITFSTRAAWRRRASVWWARWQSARSRSAQVLRLELHPDDCAHAAVRRCWTRLLERELRRRAPLRLAEAAALTERPSPLRAPG
jgi:uncharacterized protein